MLKLKICGIKDEKNAEEVSGLDIDFLGLIFAESPRQIDTMKAKRLSEIAHDKAKKVVGVFVDETLENILECVQKAKLDGVQIYRRLSLEEFKILKKKDVFIWQVVSVSDSLNLEGEIYTDLVLFDAKGVLKGGNGFSFNWDLLKNYTKDFALAGGIAYENIKEAVKTGAKILDINSKVENEKGLKDIEKIKQILKELKS